MQCTDTTSNTTIRNVNANNLETLITNNSLPQIACSLLTMSSPIALGVTGLSAGGSWFSRAHLPYIGKSPHYKIVALQNSSKESAEKAVHKYNLDASTATYGKIEEMVGDASVKMVVVSVKVPHHYELIKPALEAGKDVFVEWPLAANLKQAEELAQLAKDKGVKTAVGLQARQNPSIRRAKEMIEEGDIGTVQSTTMMGSGMVFGDTIMPAYEYLLPIENGANLLTIPFGHAVDALCWVVGEWESVSATLVNAKPTLVVDEGEGKTRAAKKTSHDQIGVQGTLRDGGGLVSVVYGPGMSSTGKNFYWEINGSKGSLVLEGAMGHVQMFHPKLSFVGAGEGAKLEEVRIEEAKEFSYNVAMAWEKFVGKGDGSVTTFEDALVRHRMIDAIYKSAQTGRQEKYL